MGNNEEIIKMYDDLISEYDSAIAISGSFVASAVLSLLVLFFAVVGVIVWW